MANGLRVFNANGTLQFDSGYSLGRSLFQFQTGKEDGSVTVPNVDGTKIPMIINARLGQATPSINISGNVVTWSFGGIPMFYRADCSVLVMVK